MADGDGGTSVVTGQVVEAAPGDAATGAVEGDRVTTGTRVPSSSPEMQTDRQIWAMSEKIAKSG